MKLGFVYRAAMGGFSPGSLRTVHYHDDNFAGRAGWKEIVVTAGPAFQLTASSAPEADRSAQLSNYPTDFLNSPPQDLKASFSFLQSFATTENAPRPVDEVSARGNKIGKHLSAGRAKTEGAIEPSPTKPPKATTVSAPSISWRANRQAPPRSRFTELVTARNLSFWFLFTAALIASGLGALHALEPGHGKTIVAA